MVIYAYLAAMILFTAIFTREVIAPASGATCDKRWRILAVSVNAANLAVIIGVGVLFSQSIEGNALISRDFGGPVGESIVIFLIASFIAYWWHRLTHKSGALWRMVHQLHHSPRRVEVLTAFFVHPLDSLAASLLNAGVAYLVFGASALVAALAIFYTAVFNLIAHADMRTPHWLGYLTQRPEMHRLHHERGVHARNYGLPVWDMIFGTFSNPRKSAFIGCGFDEGNASKIKAMLLMQKVET